METCAGVKQFHDIMIIFDNFVIVTRRIYEIN